MHIQNIVKSLNHRWAIYTILAGLVFIVLSVTGIIYYSRTSDLEIQKLALKQEIETLKKKKIELEKAKKSLNVEDKKLSMILTELLSASKKSGVNLGETEVGDFNDKENFRVLPITISVKGDFNQIGRFVNILEKNPRFQTKGINLSTKETKGIGIIGQIHVDYVFL